MGIKMTFMTAVDEDGNDFTYLDCSPEDFDCYLEREVELCMNAIQNPKLQPLRQNETLFSMTTWKKAMQRLNDERIAQDASKEIGR